MRLVATATLAAAALCATGPALGQIELARYRPMGPGDRWTYRHDNLNGAGTGSCVVLGWQRYERMEVVRDTLYEGEPRHVVTCQVYAMDGSPGGVSRYAVRVEADGSLTTAEVGQGGGCELVARGRIISLTVTEPGTVVVGGISYTLPGVRSWNIGGPAGPGGGSWWQEGTFGADLGAVYFESGSSRQLQPAYCNNNINVLEHAVVGGVPYGINPVDMEPPAGGLAPLPALAVRPNPTRGPLDVLFSLPEAADRVRLEVYDSIGRRIYSADLSGRPAGTSEVALDTSSWQPGLYAVHLATASGHATTLVVRSD